MSKSRWFVTIGVLLAVVFYISWLWGLLMLPFLLLALFGQDKRPAPSGFVYFLADDEAGLVKIGRTKNNPKYRVARLSGQSPHPLRLLYQYETENMEVEEVVLHDAFAHCRRHGEWFDLKCVHDKIFVEGGQEWRSSSGSSS